MQARRLIVVRGLVVIAVGTAALAMAPTILPQSVERHHEGGAPTPGPLILQSVGSFFVGGRKVHRTASEVGIYGNGDLTIDQMYVQYLMPNKPKQPAVVMIHGGTLTGASYESTPDGRMGWYEYFARRGYPSYVVDQVSRGRSGFDHAAFNDVRNSQIARQSQPNLRRVANDVAWVRFRFGPRPGVAFGDSQFPVEAVGEFSKQSVPDMSAGVPAPNDPNYAALSDLVHKLRNAILIGHSQSGQFPFRTALLDPTGIKAIVAIEPGGCNAQGYSSDEVAKLAKIPILVVFGDHLDTPQNVGPSWLPLFADCRMFVSRINSARGRARLLHNVDLGIRGNTHMIMQDKNNIQIANLIIDWLSLNMGPA